MLDWVACRQNKQTTMIHKGECRENSRLNKHETDHLTDKCKYITCSGIYDPACADNGQTYPNKCMMEFAACKEMKAISLAYKGSCFEGTRTNYLWFFAKIYWNLLLVRYEPLTGQILIQDPHFALSITKSFNSLALADALLLQKFKPFLTF